MSGHNKQCANFAQEISRWRSPKPQSIIHYRKWNKKLTELSSSDSETTRDESTSICW